MFPKISGKPLQLKCSEHAFPEFPDLLFGDTGDSISYFDATAYIQTKGLDINIIDFFKHYEYPIKALMSSYGVSDEEICKINQEGHYLIDGNLVYLFISFVEPEFFAYIYDRIHEMFSDGFCLSDTYIVKLAKSRLSESILEKIIENGEN